MNTVMPRILPVLLTIAVAFISGCRTLSSSDSETHIAEAGVPPLTELTLQEGAIHDFVFARLDYEGQRDICPQIVVYLGKGSDQLEEDQQFTVDLFSDDFGEIPFATITAPCVSVSMVSSAFDNAWQDHQGALRLTVTSGTITFTSVWIKVYTGSEVYRLHLISPDKPMHLQNYFGSERSIVCISSHRSTSMTPTRESMNGTEQHPEPYR